MFEFSSNQQAKAMWLSSLGSAIRTMVACTIVALVTLYSPLSLRRHISLPAFSYVTVILVITDATLGDTLRGCWLALQASVQSLGPAMLYFWLIKPDRLSSGMTALGVALGGFVVVLPGPKTTHLISKRIALGQIVLVYVIGFINGPSTHPVLHPLHVAASTALGVFACVLALLLPYPRLASYQVKNKSQIYAENASQRLKLYVKAYCGDHETSSPFNDGYNYNQGLCSYSCVPLVSPIWEYCSDSIWRMGEEDSKVPPPSNNYSQACYGAGKSTSTGS